jgi:hypothetical protein
VESSSIIYSIIETAKENNLNPYEYLKYLLEKLPGAKSSDLESLLPWSACLPEYCRVPAKVINSKPKRDEKPMYSTKKGHPLHNALQKLRQKFRGKDGN